MPERPKVTLLPDDARAWLDAELIRRGFAGYEEMERLLAERGYEIGKSSLHRHGQRLQRKIEAIRASTQAAMAIAAAAPDDADLRSSAVISLVQTEIFDVLIALQEADEETDSQDRLKILARAAASIADLSRASVNQKKWAVEMRGRVGAIAEEISKTARAAGMSAETAAQWREKILGIAK